MKCRNHRTTWRAIGLMVLLFAALSQQTTAIGQQCDDPSEVPLVLAPGGPLILAQNGVSCGDYDQDSWTDIYFTGKNGECKDCRGMLYRYDPQQGVFKIVTPGPQFESPGTRVYGSVFADYDADGYPEIGVEIGGKKDTEPPVLFKYDPVTKTFENIADTVFTCIATPWGFSETWCWGDVDADGFLDGIFPTYLQGDFNHGYGTYFLHNQGPRGFDSHHNQAPFELKVVNPRYPNKDCGAVGLELMNILETEGAELCDADSDGDLDFYVAGTFYQNVSDQVTGPSFNGFDADQMPADLGINSFKDEGMSFLDYDMDGDFDLLLLKVIGTNRLVVFEAKGDGSFSFADVVELPGTTQDLGFSKADWDSDGDIDVTVAEKLFQNMTMENHLSPNDCEFVYRPTSVASNELVGCFVNEGRSLTPAWADFDKDGDLDAILNQFRKEACHYDNTTYTASTPDSDRRFLRVRVVRDQLSTPPEIGTETEFGASVSIWVGGEDDGTRRRQFVSSSAGYNNQNEYTLHFALPPDPDPNDPLVDLSFDIAVDFIHDPFDGQSEGSKIGGKFYRVDQHVNPVLGNIPFKTIEDRQYANREITVFRSGRVLLNECVFEKDRRADPILSTAPPLDLPFPGSGLSKLTKPSDDLVGIQFTTSQAVKITEVIIDGVLRDTGGSCNANIAVWDVTTYPATLVANGTFRGARFGNKRSFYRMNTLLEGGKAYRLVGAVKKKRGTGTIPPATVDSVTIDGGLESSESLKGVCDATNVEDLDLADSTYVSFRFSETIADEWTDLGQPSGGGNLTGSGQLVGGGQSIIQLTGAPANASVYLVFGTGLLCRLLSGTDVVVVPAGGFIGAGTTDQNGEWSLTGTWPAGWPVGLSVYSQVILDTDPGPDYNFVASNAIAATPR